MRAVVAVGVCAALFCVACSGGKHHRASAGTTTSTTGTTAPTTGHTGTTVGTAPGSGTTTAGTTSTAPGRTARHGRKFWIGTVDDSFLQPDPRAARRLIGVAAASGANALVVSVTWHRGEKQPTGDEIRRLRVVAAAAKRHDMRPYLMLWHGLQGNTPSTPAQRKRFAGWAATVARKAPDFRDYIVGNEPNVNTFWMPQFGPNGSDVAAAAYFDLLARTYDALKGVSSRNRVIGGALASRGIDRPGTGRDTHSPVRFILDLGRQYAATGRSKPIMDLFALHPYPGHARIRPDVVHRTSNAITIGDYPRLVRVLQRAFAGTPQPADTPIIYSEFGVETTFPPRKRGWYTNFRAPVANDVVAPSVQARYYRLAFRLAYCQPHVKGLFIFHTYDERDLRGWQSGLYYADQTPKPSLPSFQATARALLRGEIACH